MVIERERVIKKMRRGREKQKNRDCGICGKEKEAFL
jgi:hypothetical protein